MTQESGAGRSLPLLGGRVVLWPGDCLEVMKELPDASVDSCVSDPPYHLTSIVKRFGKPAGNFGNGYGSGYDDKAAGVGGAMARLSRGFMGRTWDGGDIAFQPEVWAEVLRVLKPGGHLVAFGGTRTYHRMACAIEDAGFEIRDQIGWAYGTGFPKSHDVSKGIDRIRGAEREVRAKGKPVKRMIPGADQNKAGWEKNNGREYVPNESDAATPEARAWQGWGTALKPAWEPVVLARKPLTGTVAANVLEHGTGALNIDGCRVDFTSPADAGESKEKNRHADFESGPRENQIFGADNRDRGANGNYDPPARWPANLIHDGSAEVVAAFPNSGGGHWSGETPSLSGKQRLVGPESFDEESGSAARFFFSAKADQDDRLGSKHPTVKPVDLMQWLVRLVTPPGGTVLDPFAGTGTTGEAAWREGFLAILIEREAEYQADIQRRMALCLAGPEERRRESIKAAGKTEDAGPLFGGKP